MRFERLWKMKELIVERFDAQRETSVVRLIVWFEHLRLTSLHMFIYNLHVFLFPYPIPNL